MTIIKYLPLVFLLAFCSKSPTASKETEVKPPKPVVVKDTTRYAALFYFSGYGESLYQEDGLSPSGDAWVMGGQTPAYSPPGNVNFWGKPLWAAEHGDKTIKNNYRFYFNHDPKQSNDALLDYHADLISKAGVDFIVLDFTNGAKDFPRGPSYISGTEALCNSWQKRIEKGLPTPKIAFFVLNEQTLGVVEEAFFKKYKSELFFNYLDKKLLLVAQPNSSLGSADPAQPAVPTNGRFASYTTRHCWGLETSGKFWQFKVNSDIPPPAFYYKGEPEQMSATVATQATYMTTNGTSVTEGAQGRQNGEYFKKHMAAATNIGVKFVFINGWNEWHALNVSPNLEFPHFVDCWKTEYSADIEPMDGGHGDQYYQLMKTEIAKFKKVKK